MKKLDFPTSWPVMAMAILAAAALLFRPVFPVDETRYLTVAWEMWLRGDWLAPLTVNFEPYHHKPPMLFWMINAFWSLFGVSRWPALVPVILMALACVYLTRKIAQKLFPDQENITTAVTYIMMGSLPFLIYNTMMMFDVTLTVFVLLSLWVVIDFAERRKWYSVLLLALTLGLGVLTKGPVAWLYVLFPVIFAPLWMQGMKGKVSWYGGCIAAYLLSTIPVLMWLVPVVSATNDHFAFMLVWEQTAGRITGKMGSSHARPVYFFLPLIPVMLMPWIFFPSFWKGMRSAKSMIKSDRGLRFVLFWFVPTFIAFSLISGKQPHYMVPLLPGFIMVMAHVMQMDVRRMVKVSMAMVAFFFVWQGAASQIFFHKYDLSDVAQYVHDNQDKDWAFVATYHGELTFLGRLEIPIEGGWQFHNLDEWFAEHPEGEAIMKYGDADPVDDFEEVMSFPYRSRHLGIFKQKAQE